MESVQDLGLIDIIRLKNQLNKLTQLGQLPQQDYNALSQTLDQMSFAFVDEQQETSLPDLVSQFHRENPKIDFSPLDIIFRQQRFEVLSELRSDRLSPPNKASTVDVSTVIEGITDLKVRPFTWSDKSQRFEMLLTELINQETPKTLGKQLACFFGHDNKVVQLSGLPEFRPNIVRHLYLAKLVDKEHALVFHQDENEIRCHLRDREERLRLEFGQEEITVEHHYQGDKELHALMMKALIGPRPTKMLSDLTLTWDGPGYSPLVHTLFGRNQPSQREMEIFYVRTGVDLEGHQNSLNRWHTKHISQESTELNALLELINQHRLIYDVLQIASFHSLSEKPEELNNRWLTMAQSLARADKDENERIIEDGRLKKLHRHQEDSKRRLAATKHKEDDDEIAFEQNLNEPRELEAEDITGLKVPKKERSDEDVLVDTHSNWNQYLKPFLSTNWLGLIGIGLIMAAWAIFSMVVWGKGEYYRLAAGAIPLLFVTIGAAWVTQFFSNIKTNVGVPNSTGDNGGDIDLINRKPVQLFSCLTTWTMPFNILMVNSMLASGDSIIAMLMLFVYSGAIWFISPWLRKSYGFSPAPYLLISHGILVLPAILQLIFPSHTFGNLAFSLALVVYLSFSYYSKIFYDLRKHHGDNNQTFLLVLLGIHAVLGLAATHIFYQALPALGTIAVLVELIALSMLYISFLNRRADDTTTRQAKITIVAGAATVFGNLLAFSAPEYLLATLLLSGLFWAAICRTIKAKWPAEIIAVHCLAYIVSLQNSFAFNEVTFLCLALIFGLGLWVIENRFVKHEIKLFSLVIPLALTLTALNNPATGFLATALTIGVLLALASYNYLRCAISCQTILWYIATAVIVAVPAMALAQWLDLRVLALYVSAWAVLWAFTSQKINDMPAQLHRTSFLWAISGFASLLLFIGAIEIEFTLNHLWFYALALNIIALVFCAKRAQSMLPIYLAGALIGLVAFWFKHEYEIVSKSGLGSAIMALTLIVAAPVLQQLAFFNTGKAAERFFSRSFFLHSKCYLRLSLEQLAWGLLAISIVKTIILFSPSADNIKLSLASLTHITCLILLSRRYQLAWVTGIAAIPLFILVSALTLSMPIVYAPIFLLTCLLTWVFALRHSKNLVGAIAIIHRPLVDAHKVLSYAFLPSALLAYGFLVYVNAAPWQFLLFGAMSLTYLHRAFVCNGALRLSHVSLLHITILWSLGFFLAMSGGDFHAFLNTINISLEIWYFIGLLFLLFIPAYLMEWFSYDNTQAYYASIQQWLPAFSLMLILLMAAAYLTGESLSLASYALCLASIHCANRTYHHQLLFIGKWLTCCLMAYSIIPNNTYALLLGCFLFLAVELLLHFFAQSKLLQIQGVGDYWKTSINKVAKTGLLAMSMTLVSHAMVFIGGLQNTINAVYLFSLLPVCFFLYKTLKWEALTYLFVLIFVYTNMFIALSFKPEVLALGLNSIHLISGAFMVSILSLALALRFMPLAPEPPTPPPSHKSPPPLKSYGVEVTQ